MERESNPMQALCRSGCGFYGSPATDGLCSLCYKENLKKKQQLPTNTPASLSTHHRETTTGQTTISHLTPQHSNSDLTSADVSVSDPIAIESVQQQQATASSPVGAAPSPPVDIADQLGAAATSSAASSPTPLSDNSGSDKDGDKDAKKKKNRCAVCRKKLGLTGFECRCGGLFCGIHRYSDKHDCSFNYREMGAQEIRRNNPVVVGEKIQKI